MIARPLKDGTPMLCRPCLMVGEKSPLHASRFPEAEEHLPQTRKTHSPTPNCQNKNE